MIVQEYHIIYCITVKIFTYIDLKKIFKVNCLTLRYLWLRYCCWNLLEIHLLNVWSNPIVKFGYIYYDMVDFAGQNKIKSKRKEASLMGIHYIFFYSILIALAWWRNAHKTLQQCCTTNHMLFTCMIKTIFSC